MSVAAGIGIKRLRLTGGEPLVRLGVADLIRGLNRIPGIESIALTTNGILLPKMADELKSAGLSRVNISLDTLDPAQYAAITRRDKFDEAMAGIDAALEAGFDPVKLNSVVVRSLDQDVFGFACMSIDVHCMCASLNTCPWAKAPGRAAAAGAKRCYRERRAFRHDKRTGRRVRVLERLSLLGAASLLAGVLRVTSSSRVRRVRSASFLRFRAIFAANAIASFDGGWQKFVRAFSRTKNSTCVPHCVRAKETRPCAMFWRRFGAKTRRAS